MADIIKFPENITYENKIELMNSFDDKFRNLLKWASDKNIGQHELTLHTLLPLFTVLWVRSEKDIVGSVDYIFKNLAIIVANTVQKGTLIDLSEDQVFKGTLCSKEEVVSAIQNITGSVATRTTVLNQMNKNLPDTKTYKKNLEEFNEPLEDLDFGDIDFVFE